ncbi:Ig-like domain repeat protein [Methanobrevibacter wolinii]|uniref:Ig-like domain repeat protein n=1 Tax=Methanobrevibacter wolinii TaxID=190977 RepID=UPI0005B29E08|nr:C1 family peptidase [Methanobrevibacter wolinii]
MIKNYRFIFSLFLLILFLVSVSLVSAENVNNINSNNLNTNLSSNIVSNNNYSLNSSQDVYYSSEDDVEYDVYFNSSVDINGNGSKDNPYKYFNYNINGKKAFFANGNYSLNRVYSINSFTTMTGESKNGVIINGYGFDISNVGNLKLNNLILLDTNIKVYRNLSAINVDFINCSKSINLNSNTFGGAIYAKQYSSTYYKPVVNLINCSFLGSKSAYGGSIYIANGTLNIGDSIFMNSSSSIYGGAIAVYNSILNISNSLFSGNIALSNAGGAIYSLNSVLTLKNTNFTNCNATFGGAISVLDSNISLSSSKFIENHAKYEGGGIFDIYSPINIINSTFTKNNAMNGGALYVDNGSSFKLTSNDFTLNNASGLGGAIFSNGNPIFEMDNITFTDNYGNNTSNNLYNQTFWPLYYGGSNVKIIVNKDKKYEGAIPSKYNLVDYGYVSPIKNQMDGGSCWAFAALAALESSILKANNQTYDFSEENMKNLAVYYSQYGLMFIGSNKLLPNEGGFNSMSVGYLVSWQGPINESLEKYDDYSYISHLFNNETIMHVQNVYYIPPRENYTDNDNIKRAILNYGAVAVSMYYNSYYLNGYSYYSNTFNSANHAVTIVGWDDNYSKDHFSYTPEANGAWIVKNSWGNNWGNNGYFYVSYYDTKFCEVNTQDAFCFILNDSTKYNKNYQYDVGGMSDWFVTGKNTIWYKNTFTAISNDYLSAFSTYFNSTVTDYIAYVYLNDKLVDSISGSTLSGYYTIKLNKLIPLFKGDKFTIAIRINTTGLASFPIEEISAYRLTLHPNVSYFSYDGNDWYDLYNYSLNMPNYGHYYNGGQVACIKAFTTNPNGLRNASIVVENVTSKTMDNTTIKAIVTDSNNGSLVDDGVVFFEIDGKNYTAILNKGIAEFNYTFINPGNYSIVGYYLGGTDYSSSNKSSKGFVYINKMSTSILIENKGKSKVGNNDYIVFIVKDENGNAINNGKLIIKVNNNEKTYDLSNGSAYYIINSDKEAVFTINAFYNENNMYKSSTNSSIVNITKLNIDFEINVNGKNISIISNDEFGDNINLDDMINISIYDSNGNLISVNTFNLKNGNFTYLCDDPGNYTIKIISNETNKYNALNYSSIINLVSYTVLDFDFPNNTKVNSSYNLKVNVCDWNNKAIDEGIITYYIFYNGNSLDIKNIKVKSGLTSLPYVFNKVGVYTFIISYSDGNGKYAYNQSSNLLVNVSKLSSYINIDTENIFLGNNLIIKVNVNPLATGLVSININGSNKFASLNNGFAVFNLSNLTVGNYILNVNYLGDDYYDSSEGLVNFTVYDISSKLDIDVINQSIVVKLTDSLGNPIVNAPVNCIINNVNSTFITNNNGLIIIHNLYGKIKFTAIFNESNYSKSKSSLIIFIKNHIRKNTFIEYNNFTQTAVDFYHGERGNYFNVVLKDSYGNLLSNKSVSIGFNGVVYNLITDKKGIARLQINLAWSGIYTFAVAFLGDDNYNGSFVVAKITINPKKTQLTSKNLIYKLSVSRKTITVKLTGLSATNNKKTVNAVGKNIKITVNGKTYNVKTNDNGLAIINVSIYKKGTYIVVTKFSGDGTFSSNSCTSKLVIK